MGSLIHKAKAEFRSVAALDRSDWCVTTPSRDFKAEDTHQDHKASDEAKHGAVAGHLSNGAMKKIPKVPFVGVYLSLM
jgi:hypothetical protein